MTAPCRDNFKEMTKRTLAGRVGHRCSNPDCRKETSGPSQDESSTINIGVAAHIIAAAPKGPRCDESLTSAERSSISNGLWLCQNCAKLIDSDTDLYSVELLREWKKDSEAQAFKRISTSEAVPSIPVIELDEADKEFLKSLRLSDEDDIQSVTARMLTAANNDIEAFRNAREWPSKVIPLNLILSSDDKPARVTLDGVAKAVQTTEGVCFISPPGTGKTTTLIQLGDSIISGGQIAAFVPLGEWSDRSESFFEFLARRNAFRSFNPEHFMQVAYHGSLILLLDGWNELNPDARKRAWNDLTTLRRDFPQLGIVIATRQQAIPIPGDVIKIDLLSDEQQLELAQQYRGKDGEKIVDQAWLTSGLRELISIPLYFNALLATTPGSIFPRSKEEVLDSFVTQHENIPVKAEVLHRELLGFHKNLLVGLAVEMNKTATTTLSYEKARPVISKVVADLQASQQLTSPIQPSNVIDALVNTHALVRAENSILFQHQQFQEWYASFEVERLMVERAQNNATARRMLNADVLNWPAWEESVLFACERLSKDAASSNTVKAAILDALGIDPMLAAEMIYRSTPEIWSHISGEVVDFVKRWHTPGKIDRAVRFMITSGRPEFSEQVWPLISHTDNQIFLEALRTAQYFRPSVLGPNVAEQLAALPKDIRGNVVGEIALRSGFDGMELAATIAKNDQCPDVIIEILEDLQFRRADRHVTDILLTATDEVWKCIAQKRNPEKLFDEKQNERLVKMQQELIASATDPISIISHLTEGRIVEVNVTERITQLIQSPDFPMKDDRAQVALKNAFKAYPGAVEAGMLQRIATGLNLPFRSHEFLKNTPPVDDGPIVDIALNNTTPEHQGNLAWSVMGPVTVGKILDALFLLDDKLYAATDGQLSEPERTKYLRLQRAIICSREASFLTALLKRAITDNTNHVKLMADLIARHGGEDKKRKFQISVDIEKKLIVVFEHWIKIMLTSAEATRHQASYVVRAIERQAYPQFVSDLQKLLERDFTGREQELVEFKKTGRRPSGLSMGYAFQYRRAFAAIGDDSVVTLMKEYLPDTRGNPGWGFDAACVLMEIWNRDHPSEKDRIFSGWPDFSDVKARRNRLEDQQQELSTCDFSETIFEVVDKIGTLDNDVPLQRHALKLAKIALSMPYGRKRQEIDNLLNLPQPYTAKRDLFTAMAMAGEVLPANMLLAGFHELLEQAKKEPWRVGGQQCEVMYWLELFPFSDRPLAVLETFNSLPQDYCHPHHFRRLLTALGQSPHEEALQVLKALAECIPTMLQEYEWLDAIIRLETEKSAHAILNLICEDEIKNNYTGIRIEPEKLANLVRKFPVLYDRIFQCYKKLTNGTSKTIIEDVLIELADTSAVLAIIQSRASQMQPYDGRLERAIKKLAIGQCPATDWPGAFEQFSVPLVKFRKELFAMIQADETEAYLAEACLNKIERLRDKYGRINDEPRHPDIDSGQAWPKEAGVQ